MKMNSKKIGVVTFHFSANYGSALQCYALKKTLSLHGYDSTVIDYCPSYQTVGYNTYNSFKDYCETQDNKNVFFLLMKNTAKNIKGFFNFAKRTKNKKYEKFRNDNLKLTRAYKHVKDIDDVFDIYISGSDQIWNYHCVRDKEYGGVYDKAYFLSFAQNKKKIAYAVSAQHGEIRTDLDEDVLSLINQYDYISTREAALTKTLHELGRADAVTVLDPTLLLDKKYYQCVEAKVGYKDDNYILVYNLPGANSTLLESLIQKVAKQTGCSIVDISPKPYAGLVSEKIKTCGPSEFLTYIHNAKYVLTDSFHAVAFSLIYHKNFFCVLREKNDERIKNILSMSGLMDRLVESADDEITEELIDFEAVDQKMRPAKEASIQFLLKGLGK